MIDCAPETDERIGESEVNGTDACPVGRDSERFDSVNIFVEFGINGTVVVPPYAVEHPVAFDVRERFKHFRASLFIRG